jgi:hypothetical protein
MGPTKGRICDLCCGANHEDQPNQKDKLHEHTPKHHGRIGERPAQWFPYMRAYGAKAEFFNDEYKFPTINKVENFHQLLK